jgi:hypothetical protein
LSAGQLGSSGEGHEKEAIRLIHSIVMRLADPEGNRTTE